MKPMHVLVPIDFGPAANRALEWAADLVKSVGGTVDLVNIIQPFPAGDGMTPIVLSPEDFSDRERALRDVATSCGIKGEIDVLVHPYAGPAILNLARDRNVDLLVMGTHGRGGLARAFVGSVADYLVRNADCPVVVFREKE